MVPVYMCMVMSNVMVSMRLSSIYTTHRYHGYARHRQ
jgi:hypothetical protein